jgi:hypothetical protein
MEKEILALFEGMNSEGNCLILASDLAEKIREKGHLAEVKMVVNKLSVFGENPFFNCEHICGEKYRLHFVVNYDGFILDPKLGFPISSKEYLEKAYKNYNDLMMS